MGIVVSGEDGVAGVPSEQQKVDMIAAENDYGLVMATLDQVCVFLGSGWTFSLAGRIQVWLFLAILFGASRTDCICSGVQKLYPHPVDEHYSL